MKLHIEWRPNQYMVVDENGHKIKYGFSSDANAYDYAEAYAKEHGGTVEYIFGPGNED